MSSEEILMLWGCNMLALALNERGVQCAICFPLGEAACVRIPGVELYEAVAVASDRYEVWSLGDPPSPVPLRVDLSIDETVAFLCAADQQSGCA